MTYDPYRYDPQITRPGIWNELSKVLASSAEGLLLRNQAPGLEGIAGGERDSLAKILDSLLRDRDQFQKSVLDLIAEADPWSQGSYS